MACCRRNENLIFPLRHTAVLTAWKNAVPFKGGLVPIQRRISCDCSCSGFAQGKSLQEEKASRGHVGNVDRQVNSTRLMLLQLGRQNLLAAAAAGHVYERLTTDILEKNGPYRSSTPPQTCLVFPMDQKFRNGGRRLRPFQLSTQGWHSGNISVQRPFHVLSARCCCCCLNKDETWAVLRAGFGSHQREAPWLS